jgi:Tol biopolymer transport system component/DNA-binding winged helix-turn-helix (wHTH) protein
MSQRPDHCYEFGPFRLDAGERRLLRAGDAVPLPPKAFDLLLVLVKYHGRLLEKDELLKSVWPDMFVEEANLSYNVSLIRRALGETGDEQRYIETVPKHGYRFVADVREAPEEKPEPLIEGQPGALEHAAARKGRLVGPAVFFALALGISAAGWLIISGLIPKPPSPPLRVLPMTSYQGAERFPSFSPDGTQVAFTWDGEKQDNFDIYTCPVGNEAPFRLTNDPAMDLSPAWSPDGRWITFLRFRPDGKAGVFLTTPLSRAERQLTEIASPWIRVGFFGPFLAWSPDSKWIVTADTISPESPFGLVLISVETGEKRALTSPPQKGGNDIAPAFSPDGRSLAFIRILSFPVSELYLLRLTDDLKPRGEPVRLTYEDRRTTSPVWSQDGREIIFASGDVFNSRLYRIALNEPGKPREIESVGEAGPVLAISHTGRRLAYVREVFDPNIWRLQIGADGAVVGTPARLSPSTRVDFSQQFSPDGKKVAFVSNRSEHTEVWVCDSDGANLARLTSFGGPLTDCPRWSPDGERIVFQSHSNGQLDVFLINFRGGMPERLTHEPSDESAPSWSRDGRWIYFNSNRSGTSQVWKMRTDGSGAIQVTRQGGFAALESPDDNFLYYSKGPAHGPALWRIPVDGGEEVEVLKGISDWSTFAPVDQGIYFVPRREPTAPGSIQFLSFAEGRIATIIPIAKPVFVGLTVSPDRQSILYTQMDHEGSDLMLVEHFR